MFLQTPSKGLIDVAVLIVDDNATNRTILKANVQRWGMAPSTASNGPEALELLKQAAAAGKAFPLVVLDGHMPGMDGSEVANAIKRCPEIASATIILLASDTSTDDAARCAKLGIAAHLLKPIKPSELMQAMLKVLGKLDAPESLELGNGRQPAVRAETLAPAAAKLRVLLAEDNAMNQRVATRLLERDGHVVTLCQNGREAVETWKREIFDLVLMDVSMPEMDGFAATAHIRERERRRGGHIPIVAMTAHAMKGDRERCLDAGMDDYLAKPIRPKELRTMLERIIPEAKCDAAFDRVAALERVDGDEEFFRTLIDLFLRDCPGWQHDMHQGLVEGNWKLVGRAAHTLKGAAANLEAGPTVEAGQKLETAAAEHDEPSARSSLAHLDVELKRCLQALSSF
jgi:two-component system sensor histidine kinase/response regulator